MKKMTFEQFQATRRECADLGEALRDEMRRDDGSPMTGLLYVDSLYIEREPDGRYCLTIGNFSDVSADLEPFERRLYKFARSEGYCDVAA